MYLSLNWLKENVAIPKSVTPEDIAKKLTLHTVEVEKIENQAEKFDKIVIGKVLEVKKHPGADRLNLVKVDVADNEALDIVCGAPNLEKGQLVPVALVGAVLPGDFEIEEREVRGEKSCGMICAEDELGLGDDHEGIMVLSKKAKIGQAFGEYLKLNDVIFEVDNKSLSNRPDLWGHLGIAREMAVFLETKISKNFEKISKDKLTSETVENLNIKIENTKICPRYMGAKINNIEVKESPEWIKERLIAVGMRPINNIVDATNYVMLEIGQPMHAFDADLVSDIVVRLAKKGETLKTLDGEERKLDESMLLIANNKEPLAIAGVMGGEKSEINLDTKSIILESANFLAESIRKTSTKLSLRTEASMRFEKALDPNMCEQALARCFSLIKETCPKAEVVSSIFDEKNFGLNLGPIELKLEWLYKRLGTKIDNKKTIKILENLGFEIADSGSDILSIKIPTWRATKDISLKEDVLEEVARIYGYENISSQMPEIEMEAPVINEERMFERKVKDILSLGASLTEAYNYSFVGEEKLKKLKINKEGYIRLVNPATILHTMLRQNLFVNLIDNIKTNQARVEEIGLFEIGNIFRDVPGRINKNDKKNETLPYQEKHLALINAGNEVIERAKSELEYLLSSFGLKVKYEIVEQFPEWSLKSSFAKIKVENSKGIEADIGLISKIDKSVLSSLGVKKEVAVVEISFEKMFNIASSSPVNFYKKGGKFPPAMRDLAFVIPSKVLYNDIKDEIENSNELVVDVELFDIYQGKNLEKGKRSLAFHVIYLSLERTLTREEVDVMQKKLIADLGKKFDAKIRDF